MISFMVKQKNCRKTAVQMCSSFLLPKITVAGKNYLVFAGLRWRMIEFFNKIVDFYIFIELM